LTQNTDNDADDKDADVNDVEKTEENNKSAMQKFSDLESAFADAKKAELMSGDASGSETGKSEAQFLDEFIAFADSSEADVKERAEDWLFDFARTATGSDAVKTLDKLGEVKPVSAYVAIHNRCKVRSIASKEWKQWLADILAGAKNANVKAYAMHFTAGMLDSLEEEMHLLEEPGIFVEAPELAAVLQALKDDDLNAEIEHLLNSIQADYADVVATGGGTMGELAASIKYRRNNLVVGQTPPDISAEDLDGVEFKLSDYRGKIVMLSFWGAW